MILIALTTTTFVAAVVPNFTVAPVWKPVPLIVTAVPPPYVPLTGETEVTVTGTTATFADFASLQFVLVVTVTTAARPPWSPRSRAPGWC